MTLRRTAGRAPGLQLALTLAAVPLLAQPVAAQPAAAPAGCEIHVYPADGAHSVGEDFDAVHKLDQDIATYYRTAGRNLNWLSIERQQALLATLDLGSLGGVGVGTATFHPAALTRHGATAPGPRTPLGAGCRLEVMVPQILLERGGLSNRSLRVFGVVRHYDHGQLIHGFSGFASAPMSGFSLRSPIEADAATAVVEAAYVGAVDKLLRFSVISAESKTRL